MSQENQKYYIGLDCGTSSVGWAVTDDKYNLLCANGKVKKEGKTKTKKRALWGVRLFDEADTAAERRTFRHAQAGPSLHVLTGLVPPYLLPF